VAEAGAPKTSSVCG